ncbi:unnamed protein product [Ectocarpus sp. 12 AP-2014]
MSNFVATQSLSINQRRNARLNEYFAVVGLHDGPLLLSDPIPNESPPSPGRSSTVPPPPADKKKNGDGAVFEDHTGGEVNSGGSRVAAAAAAAAAVTPAMKGGGTGGGSSLDKSTDTTKSNGTASTVGLNSHGGSSNSSSSDGGSSDSSSTDRETTTTTTGRLAEGVPQKGCAAESAPPPTPFVRPNLVKRRTYGSCELGKIQARPGGMSGPLHTRFRARVLHRFPGYDHKGNGCAFPANLPLFCLPGGLKLSLEMTLPTFFTFVHTRANGQHMFGYCLCLHEPLGTRHRIELQGLVDAHNKAASRAEGGENNATEPLTILDPGREVYAPKCLCLLSTWPYFGPFREWLLNLYRISLSPFQIPLERYVGNFLLEVPTPSPGRVEVLYNMGNTTITFACPPPNKPVAWGSVPFEPLFQCLSHENIVTLLTCLLLERSVLLKSSQLSLLTPCAEVLTLVLYPLSWSHVYIPVLPEALLGVLAAPMPFLIGVHRSFVEGTGMDVAPYVVQVDLDNDVVEMGGEEAATMPRLPQKRRSKLLAKLAEHAQLGHCRTPAYRQDVMQKSDLAFSMAIRPCDFDDDELDTPPPDWDAVR